MENHELFMIVGQWLASFLLSLANIHPNDIDPKLFWIMSLIASIVVWIWVLKIAIAILKKVTGFDHPTPRQ